MYNREQLDMLNFLLDNDMIIISEYDFWEELPLLQQNTLLSLALNDIANMLDDICNCREMSDDEKIKETKYIKYIRHIIEVELYNINNLLESGE